MENQERICLPGRGFNPNDEELVGFYLKRKVNSEYHGDVIPDIDLHMDPSDIKATVVTYQRQDECYYFGCIKRKYATGAKIDRTTQTGFWKASGADKAVVSKNGEKIGIKRRFVFYERRAPNTKERTDWITYEYRLLTYPHGPPDQPQEYQEWVVCKGLKNSPPPQIGFENQLVGEIPQLRGIPNANSTIFGTTQDQGLYGQNSIYNMGANNEEERSRQLMMGPATYLQNSMAYNMPARSSQVMIDPATFEQNSMAYNMLDPATFEQNSMAYNMPTMSSQVMIDPATFEQNSVAYNMLDPATFGQNSMAYNMPTMSSQVMIDPATYVQNSMPYNMPAMSSQVMIDPATSSYSFPITSTSDYDQNSISQVPEGYRTRYI